jgi:hypothetical protein
MQVDPLAELAPDWTPYRFGFNNPMINVDPLGLFESRGDAKQYAEENDIKTGLFSRNKIRKQSDGTYAIENRKDHSSIFEDSELGVITAALVAAPKDGLTGLLAPERRDPYTGFVGGLEYIFTGGIDGAYNYNKDGYPTGLAPITGTPPTGPSKLKNVVYISKTASGTIQYVGITNNLARRAAQHLASKGIQIEPLMKNLSRADARAVEQALIEINKLGKNGGSLLNKINSISQKNPKYAKSLQKGYDLLKSIGYN